VFRVRRIYQTGSVITVQHEVGVECDCRCPSWSTTERLMRTTEHSGSVTANKKGAVGRKKCVRSPRVQEVLPGSPMPSPQLRR
jgi:hypothetical protein